MDKGFESLLRQVRQLFPLYSKDFLQVRSSQLYTGAPARKKYIGEVVAVDTKNRIESRLLTATTSCDNLSRRHSYERKGTGTRTGKCS